MTQSGFQLAGNAAALYEEQKVPAMFAPLADATLASLNLSPDEDVIDIACGTGIVARKIRELLGTNSRVVGVDLNEPMIEIARNLQDVYSQSCEWHISDATDLPFKDNEFSIAFCQQGIQFIPDKKGVLREAYRVLQPNGRIVLTVWDGIAEFMLPMVDSLSRNVSSEVSNIAKAPFAYDARRLLPLIENTGFKNIIIDSITINRTIASTEQAIRNEIMGMPFGHLVKAKGDEILNNVIHETLIGLSKFQLDDNFVIPQQTYLIQATLRD
ncbi:MAG: methyltransferase domain-containing protein [Rhizobiales bacterium]|nr:methyltransferase domain-containing protein [Hyphomicrobiales bacterium]NRB13886.1 methyltransferase domain-containing protein [Hyphomicrobiales bacterium]